MLVSVHLFEQRRIDFGSRYTFHVTNKSGFLCVTLHPLFDLEGPVSAWHCLTASFRLLPELLDMTFMERSFFMFVAQKMHKKNTHKPAPVIYSSPNLKW
jgi:hypothetical protein